MENNLDEQLKREYAEVYVLLTKLKGRAFSIWLTHSKNITQGHIDRMKELKEALEPVVGDKND